ncbi:MAG TPA: hypothetical protein VG405_11490 [Solirubrobacteraceae bacterium]|nr:hypothetical protein [Solirubrobacteraceae bacterium]
MRRRFICGPAAFIAAGLSCVGLAGPVAGASGSLCTGTYGGTPRVGAPLRFGVDPGLAGSAGGVQLPAKPDRLSADVAAVRRLHPARRVLVVRLNRLFWSSGKAGIRSFERLTRRYGRAGLKVEIQVRYHPTSAENGNLRKWRAWVRHVVAVFGRFHPVVDMTITNEVNLNASPNTSDGSYKNAEAALVQGIEAAHAQAVRRGWRRLRFGFTYAYRWNPSSDESFWQYLGAHGGRRFRRALGFVGLDFYPGSFYPPTMVGGSYSSDTEEALGTLRECFLPEARIAKRTPLWITENGVPTGAGESDDAQASALRQLVSAVRAYSGTFHVTDYRWFNLRDSNSSATGSLPGASDSFATDGLMTDAYEAKPSFWTYRSLIARYGRH